MRISLMGLLLIGGGTSFADQSTKEKEKTVTTNLKFRFIDSFELMRETEEGKKISQELQETYKKYTAEIQKDDEELAKEKSEYARKRSMLSETAREAEEKKLIKKERELKNKIQEKEEEYKMTFNKATEQVFKEITEAVTKTAKEEGLDAVFDINSGRALYVADNVNYTAKVKNSMNEKYKTKLAKNDSGKKAATA